MLTQGLSVNRFFLHEKSRIYQNTIVMKWPCQNYNDWNKGWIILFKNIVKLKIIFLEEYDLWNCLSLLLCITSLQIWISLFLKYSILKNVLRTQKREKS